MYIFFSSALIWCGSHKLLQAIKSVKALNSLVVINTFLSWQIMRFLCGTFYNWHPKTLPHLLSFDTHNLRNVKHQFDHRCPGLGEHETEFSSWPALCSFVRFRVLGSCG